MCSDQIKLGFERAPHRGLLRATGVVGEAEQMQQRLREARSPRGRVQSSWLRRYAALVTSANTGAVLTDL